MNKIKHLLCILSAILISSQLIALSGKDVMYKVYEQGRIHKSQVSRVDMVISDDKTRTKERSFVNKTKILKKTTKSLIRIFQPTRLKGTAILTETEDDGSGESKQWSYLPSFKVVRALNSHNKTQSFMGSDLTNDDVGGRHPSRDEHDLIEETADFYTVESIPKDTADLYSKLITQVHKVSMLPTQIDFYSEGELLKTLTTKKIGISNKMYYSKESLVVNAQTGGKTRMMVTNLDTNSKIRNGEVSLQGLKQ